MTAIPDPIMILDLPVHPLRKAELVSLIDEWAGGDTKRRVYNLNVHATNIAGRESRFAESLRSADLVYCDGAGIMLGARMHGYMIPERLSVMDWFDDFLAAIGRSRRSVFLLGDEDGVAGKCVQRILRGHPSVQVAGYHHGYFDPHGSDNSTVVDLINASAADILLVGMGMPRQEYWIDDNLGQLSSRVLVPVGAAFRWYSREARVAPRWVSHAGLEWMWRLAHQPLRLARRYLVGNPQFLFRVLVAARR